jgi:hypothetical protein
MISYGIRQSGEANELRTRRKMAMCLWAADIETSSIVREVSSGDGMEFECGEVHGGSGVMVEDRPSAGHPRDLNNGIKG